MGKHFKYHNSKLEQLSQMDRLIQTGWYTLEDIRQNLEWKWGNCSGSTVEKNMRLMREYYDAPIIHCRKTRKYKYSEDYRFKDAVLLSLGYTLN